MTITTALEKCRDLWKWLKQDNNREKQEWPGWEGTVGKNSCPCCEYVVQNYGSLDCW